MISTSTAISKFTNLLRLETTKNVVINNTGNFLALLMTAFYTFFLTRVLPREEVGIFQVLLTISFVLTSVLDFGVTASIYANLPLIPYNNINEKISFIKSNYLFQTMFSGLVLLIFFLFHALILDFLKLKISLFLYFITLLSVEAFLLQNFITNILMATKQVLLNNIGVNISNVFRTLSLLLIFFSRNNNLTLIIIITALIAPLLTLVILLFVKRHLIALLFTAPIRRSYVYLNYSLTYYFATIMYNFANRVDLLILSHFLVKELVGEYAMAQKLILVIMSIIIAVSQVLSPYFSSVKSRSELKKLVKKSFVYLSIPAFACLVAMILPEQFYLFYFTKNYTHTGLITRILAIAFFMSAYLTIPNLFFLYTVRKNIHLLRFNFLYALIIVTGCWFGVQKYGLLAPPFVFILAHIFVGLYCYIFMRKEIRSLPA